MPRTNPSDKIWQRWLERLYNLRRDKRRDHERPHKPVLLLAVLDLLDRNVLKKNEIPFSNILASVFKKYFAVVRQGDDQPSLENPFWHLSGDGFWKVRAERGGRPLYEPGNATGPPTMGVLRNTHGEFDPEFFELFLQNPFSRHQLRDALVARYFPDQREQIAAIVGQEGVALADNTLREQPPGRDAAFRNIVLEIYDHTCAACGLRVKLQDGFSLMDAAHIIPFGVSGNDRPDNGIALCPNHHRAMDAFLISPCPHPDLKAGIWQLSKRIDDRLDARKDLVSLNGKPVLQPKERIFFPARKGLDWREQRLKVHY